MRPLVWIRVDLRARDNTALARAAERATKGVLAVFLVSPGEWKEHDEAAAKIDFRLRNLAELSKTLEKRNIPLLVRTVKDVDTIPKTLLDLAREHHCTGLFFNSQYEINERRRDAAVVKTFAEAGLETHEFSDQLVIAPGTLRTGEGKPYTVFTPFKKKWIAHFKDAVDLRVAGLPAKQSELITKPDDVPDSVPGAKKAFTPDIDRDTLIDLWPAGEPAAKRRLDAFLEKRVRDYNDNRDFPAIDGTSRLSAWMNSGVISTRQCLAAALEANNNRLDSGARGPQTWISELIWREFYRNILFSFPRISMNQPFQTYTRKLNWSHDDNAFNAWTRGKTGYPIVDAAMRQLNTTAWMHNRLRMIVASFLTKDLFIDWRRGERYFMQRLIDGDLASNNGGWQWAASTGTDAQPYFRIFNPESQSKRFDPDGAFIRAHCPELESLPGKHIHNPPPEQREGVDYPDPIVDHAEAREKTLAAFKALKK